MKKFTPTYDDLAIMASSLSHLLHAGIGTADALYLLSEDAQPSFCRLYGDMAQNADSGRSLAGCFADAGVFPGYLCTLLHVGEQVGKTEQTLRQLSQYYHNMARLQRQLMSALTYPAVLLAVLLAVLVVLLTWVMPVFDSVYQQFGSGLTGISAILLNVGGYIRICLPWLGVLLMMALLLFAIPSLRKGVQNRWLKFFGDRGVFKSMHNARFMQALSLGITSGMTAGEACQMAASMAQNTQHFYDRCTQCLNLLQKDHTLASALKQCGLISSAESRLLQAGIRSGKAEAALGEIADRQLAQSEERICALAEKVEPAVVVIACILIGLVLLSVMLPLINIMNTIGM